MNPGDRVRVERDGVVDEGVVTPSTTRERIVLKLDGGYNVGVDREAASVEVLERDAYDLGDDDGATEPTSEIRFDDDLPTIALVSTGGTIASTVDYRTGAVTARFDAEDILRAVPELAGRANYRGRVVANVLSENMEPSIWGELIEAIAEEIDRGADGVVVTHGTDTMAYSAAAVAFALETPVPIVFTGSQRSADRPSSDNVMNAVCAVEAAKSDCAEVLICMHASESDDRCALHRGVRARKNHTSRRDAFDTVGARPLGVVDYDAAGDVDPESADAEALRSPAGVEFRRDDYARRGETDLAVAPALNDGVEHVKFTPGMSHAALSHLDDADGVVIEGTGLGHVHTDLIPRIEELVDDGTVVAMTSQCIEGRVCDRVYDTGRDLLAAGVVECGDTLPETATVKLMWALEHADDPAAAMERSLAGELTEQSRPWT